VAYDIFEIRETKSLLERRELAAEKFGARQWWSFFKGSAFGQVMGWARSCCCAFELRTV
jgi:hypothetical protein